MKIKIIIIILFVINSISFTQQGMESIIKSYSSWTTNFDKKTIDLNEIIAGGPPKDGIPALINPKFTTIIGAEDWLSDKEPVITININGFSKAYPLQILLFHEIVNDRIGTVPLLVSFCPLCYSGIVFNRTINGMPIKFGVSGLLRNSDLIMYDQLTESFWQQFTGEAIVGDMVGNKLEVITSQIISFADFKIAYPNGLVLSQKTGYKRPYGRNPYYNYDNEDSIPFLFTGDKDERLKQNEKVIGVSIGDSSKAYPYNITSEKKVIYDLFNNKDLVIFHIPGTALALESKFINDSKDVGATGVFIPFLNEEKLNFIFRDNQIIDTNTNSSWNITGNCISGKLEGEILEKVNSGDYFAFAWLVFNPNTVIYGH